MVIDVTEFFHPAILFNISSALTLLTLSFDTMDKSGSQVGNSVDLFLGTLLKELIYNIPQDPRVRQCVRNNLFCPGGRKVGEMVRFADECRASYKNAILAIF
jgi:hypothetical protein